MTPDELTGERRCWPCTVANSIVGLVVGWLPFAAALLRGDAVLVALTVVWATTVTGYIGYRLLALGYLPLSEPVAKRTGLYDRIGPASNAERDAERDDEPAHSDE